jgi:hypothetical protein
MKKINTCRVDTLNTVCDDCLKPATNTAGQQRELRRSLTASATQKYQQTALPLPATGDQTGQIARPRQENPVRLIESETL